MGNTAGRETHKHNNKGHMHARHHAFKTRRHRHSKHRHSKYHKGGIGSSPLNPSYSGTSTRKNKEGKEDKEPRLLKSVLISESFKREKIRSDKRKAVREREKKEQAERDKKVFE